MPSVSGRVTAERLDTTVRGTLIVLVQDVSEEDGSARVVGEQRIPDIAISAGESVAFEVPLGDLDERRCYAVQAQVDTGGTGELTEGDLITKQRFPVVTFGNPSTIAIAVEPV